MDNEPSRITTAIHDAIGDALDAGEHDVTGAFQEVADALVAHAMHKAADILAGRSAYEIETFARGLVAEHAEAAFDWIAETPAVARSGMN